MVQTLATRVRPALALLLSTTLAVSSFSFTLLALPQTALATHTQCSDSIDNDGDGKSDFPQDEGCSSTEDNTETIDWSQVGVSITDGRERVQPGEAVTYVITINRQGSDTLTTDVDVRLPFPIVVQSASDNGKLVSEQRVVWKSLQINQPVKTLVVYAYVSPQAVRGQQYVARVSAGGETALDATIVDPYPSLSSVYLPDDFQISISDDRDYVRPGDRLYYKVIVKNTSNLINRADVQVTLPGLGDLVEYTEGAVSRLQTLTWRNVIFDPYQEKDFAFRIVLDKNVVAPGTLRAFLTVGRVRAVDETVVRRNPVRDQLVVSVSDGQDQAMPGQLLTYVVHVQNVSPTVIPDAPIDASMPMYAEFVSATEGGTWDKGNVRWLSLMLAPNGERWMSYTVRVRQDAPVDAVLQAGATVGIYGFIARDTTRVVDTGARVERFNPLALRKEADRSEVMPGDSIRYTLYLKNTSPFPMSHLFITDSYDEAYQTVISQDAPSGIAGTIANGSIRWIVPRLEVGQLVQVSYILQISPSTPKGRMVSNEATVQGDQVGTPVSLHSSIVNVDVIDHLPVTGAALDELLAAILAIVAGASTFGVRGIRRFTL